ncbi:MAG: cache domain-containing protein [Lachnospiraceae bacterium]|nr:cache domain-containing protein [Lachnospiraceae bacterium]
MKKNLTISIRVKLLLMILLPVIALGIILTYFAATNIRAGMQEEALHGLRGAAVSLQHIYDEVDNGNWTMDASGVVKKGNLEINGHYEIVDRLKDDAEYEYTIFYGDTRITTSLKDHKTGNRLVGTKAGKQAIETVLEDGEEYSDVDVVINDEKYYAYYVPIKQDGKVIGMVFAGTPSADVDEYILSKVLAIVGISVAMLVIVLIIGVIFALGLSKAIVDAKNVIGQIGKGDLKVTVSEKAKKRNDEIGDMSNELETLVTKLTQIIKDVKKSSNTLYQSGIELGEMSNQSSATTDEISNAVEEVSRGAMNQAEETETASANVVRIGDMITDIVSSVDNLGKASKEMQEASDESAIIIGELSASNDKTTDAIDKIGKQVHTTNESVQAIRKAIEMITAIATETNLLSLNASIEAARAGEHGRGFAVVASEIQKLAEESNTSANQISEIIDNLLKDSEETVRVMDEVDGIVKEQKEKLDETKAKFNMVTEGVASTRKEAEAIEYQAGACDNARSEIMAVIENLSAISEENAASAQETNASMEELNAGLAILAQRAKDLMELSKELESSMSFFTIE